ncbi:MAG: DinB family protein [Actinobacteria bacterium]|nr:DinB family protein [Actinomycetota bacterium]
MVEGARVALNLVLIGKGAHVGPHCALDELDWGLAGREVPHAPSTIWQTLQHLIYWQELILAALRGRDVTWPEHAAEGWSFPSGPPSEEAWATGVRQFLVGLKAAQDVSIDPGVNLEEALPSWEKGNGYTALQVLASHNSYHLGQIVLLRRILGAWPPPSGGDTW